MAHEDQAVGALRDETVMKSQLLVERSKHVEESEVEQQNAARWIRREAARFEREESDKLASLRRMEAETSRSVAACREREEVCKNALQPHGARVIHANTATTTTSTIPTTTTTTTTRTRATNTDAPASASRARSGRSECSLAPRCLG